MDLLITTTKEQDADLAVLAGSQDVQDYTVNRITAYIANVCLEALSYEVSETQRIVTAVLNGTPLTVEEKSRVFAAIDAVPVKE